jgi:FtsH-binding integral membrane protein
MSRWLMHYSPFAVILRLCSLSILLSYACVSIFRFLGVIEPDLPTLSRSLPIWIVMAIVLLFVYFFTQQDISVEGDKDDRKRRLVLRLKCLYTMAGSSLFSLLVIVCLIHISTIDWGADSVPEWLRMQTANGIVWWKTFSFSRRSEL